MNGWKGPIRYFYYPWWLLLSPAATPTQIIKDIYVCSRLSTSGAHGAKVSKIIQTLLISSHWWAPTLLAAHIYFPNLWTMLVQFLLVSSCICLRQPNICCLFLQTLVSLQLHIILPYHSQQKPEVYLEIKKN